MKSHIYDPESKLTDDEREISKQLQEKENEKRAKEVIRNFTLGAHTISQLILSDYLPDIENATTEEERAKAINKLKIFCSNSSNLKKNEDESK